MNGARTVLPEAPRSCTEWEPYLAELEDVSFWRLASDVTDYPSSNKQRKKDDEVGVTVCFYARSTNLTVRSKCLITFIFETRGKTKNGTTLIA